MSIGLIQALCAVRDERVMRRFCAEILTASERRDLGLRWRLMRMLAEGMPQRAIARRLGISLCKITRGSRVLRAPGSVCAGMLGWKAKER